MSRYRKFPTNRWTCREFLALSAPPPNARDLWLFVSTGPQTTSIPGLMRVGIATIADELGWSVEATRACWAEIEAQGLGTADWSSRLVWLPSIIRDEEPANQSVVTAWRAVWEELPQCPLLAEARGALRSYLATRDQAADRRGDRKGPGYVETFDEACPAFSLNQPSSGTGHGVAHGGPHGVGHHAGHGVAHGAGHGGPHQDQDQDQDQEQEQENTDVGESASPDPAGPAVSAHSVASQPANDRSADDEPAPITSRSPTPPPVTADAQHGQGEVSEGKEVPAPPPASAEAATGQPAAGDERSTAKGAKQAVSSAQVLEVLTHWADVLYPGKKPKFSDDRKRRVRSAFREGFTVEQLKQAIDGAAQDDWIMGRDEKARPEGWRGVETVLRDVGQIERLMEKAPRKRDVALRRLPPPQSPEDERGPPPPEFLSLLAAIGGSAPRHFARVSP